MNRTQFDVSVYHNGRTRDVVTERIATNARYQHFDDEGELLRALTADCPDIIIYPDVGMTARNLPLLARRIAPIQCVAWGHPVTTGFSNIDAYFSCEAMEPAHAQGHYCEPLRLLPGIGTCFKPPDQPHRLLRHELGLPTDALLLLCPQSPHKVHPDNYAPWAAILHQLPDAKWVMFSSKYGRHTQELVAALRAHDPVLTQRLIVLPQTSHERFLQVNLACDLMLDTLRWSGGNTSLDALQCDLPIVSLGGEYMRGRQTLGMMQLMGIPELLCDSVEQYVHVAVELGRSPKHRQALSTKISTRKHRLFNDQTPIRAMERHLLDLLTEKSWDTNATDADSHHPK